MSQIAMKKGVHFWTAPGGILMTVKKQRPSPGREAWGQRIGVCLEPLLGWRVPQFSALPQ